MNDKDIGEQVRYLVLTQAMLSSMDFVKLIMKVI
jgi:hypothetical protein